jgi:hypothetical protein
MFIYQLQVSALLGLCKRVKRNRPIGIITVAAIDYDNGPQAGISLFLLLAPNGAKYDCKTLANISYKEI